MTRERRKERRRTFRHPVEVEQEFAGRRFSATVRNIGAGGMFIESREAFVEGDFVRLRFQVPGTASFISVEGQVMWCDPGDPAAQREPGAGVRYLDAPEWAVAAIRRFVEGSPAPGARGD